MKVVINDEYLEKAEDDVEFDRLHFETEKMIEVRVPFEGYYSLKINCDDPQIAMAEVLKINNLVGLLSVEGTNIEMGELNEDETYCVPVKE